MNILTRIVRAIADRVRPPQPRRYVNMRPYTEPVCLHGCEVPGERCPWGCEEPTR